MWRLEVLLCLSLWVCVPAGAAVGGERVAKPGKPVRVRSTAKAGSAKAYEAWRAKFPEHDITPRPTDGANLALSVHKLEGKGIPGKPFLIWAIGSSFTNFLGNGETLIHELRKRFPNAPPILYKKHVTSSVTWQHMRGWVRQFVVPDQPDLVLMYVHDPGPRHLGKILDHIHQHSTADVIVPSLHLRRFEKLTARRVNLAAWDKARAICREHGAEFVENRRELADFMTAHHMTIEDMTVDAVHQTPLCALLINENIARHVAPCAKPAYRALDRERRVRVQGATKRAPRGVRVSDDWTEGPHGTLQAGRKGATLSITFTGNRVDLIGRRSARGGTAKVIIDGVPADRISAFYTTMIAPGKQNTYKGKPYLTLVNLPHGVVLGQNVVPQDWTLTMTDNAGNYRVVGSVTGPDGTGNVFRRFTSNSGQIIIDPELWRGNQRRKGKTEVGSRKGHTYSFSVYRCACGTVSFRGSAAMFHVPLVQNLPNGKHTLELVAEGGGPVRVDSFGVYTPPK